MPYYLVNSSTVSPETEERKFSGKSTSVIGPNTKYCENGIPVVGMREDKVEHGTFKWALKDVEELTGAGRVSRRRG